MSPFRRRRLAWPRRTSMTRLSDSEVSGSVTGTIGPAGGGIAGTGSTGIADEHVALHDTVRRWVEQRCTRDVVRAPLDTPDDVLPPFWSELAAQGWLGLHLPEDSGGEGFGLAEVAIVVEELARACAPGPFLSTVLASAAIDLGGTDEQTAALATRLGRRLGRWRLRRASRGHHQDVRRGAGARRRAGRRVRARRPGRAARGRTRRRAGRPLRQSRRHPTGRVGRAGRVGRPRPLPRPTRRCGGWGADRRRCRRRHGVVRGHCRRLREGARAVRSADRSVPSGEAPLRGHAAASRGGPGQRLGRGPTHRGAGARAGRRRRGRQLRRCRLRGGQGLHPGARWHRLHVGARCAPVSEARDGDAPALPGATHGRTGSRVGSRRGSTRAERRAATRSRRHPARRARLPRAALRHREVRLERHHGRCGVPRALLARAVGSRCGPRRATRHRRGVRRGPRAPTTPPGRCVGAAHDHRPWHARAAGTMGRSHPAGRDPLVSDVQRARRRQRPGLAHHACRPGRRRLGPHRAEGLDDDGAPGGLGHLPGAHRPARREARGHHVLPGRHGLGGARHPPAARAHGSRAVQRGVPRRCVRARRLRDRRREPGLGGSAHDAGQRTGVDGQWVVVRARRRGDPGRSGPMASARTRQPSGRWWPRRRPSR